MQASVMRCTFVGNVGLWRARVRSNTWQSTSEDSFLQTCPSSCFHITDSSHPLDGGTPQRLQAQELTSMSSSIEHLRHQVHVGSSATFLCKDDLGLSSMGAPWVTVTPRKSLTKTQMFEECTYYTFVYICADLPCLRIARISLDLKWNDFINLGSESLHFTYLQIVFLDSESF